MKKKILIIDDEEDVTACLSSKLKMEDYEPIVASNGEEGYALVLKYKVDAVVTDVVMAGMDGYVLCKKMKSIEELSEIPT